MEDQLFEIVQRFREHERRDEVELEIRMGFFSKEDGSFRVGVSREVFDTLLDDLRHAEGLQTDGKFSEFVDYYYVNDKGVNARTRVQFDTDDMTMSSKHTCKTTMSSCVISTEHQGDERACRVSISTETDVQNVPSICIPTHVRIQQRIQFKDVRNGNVVWSYDLSRTWSGPNRTSVEHNQNVLEPTYEVECELVDMSNEYVDSHSTNFVTKSLRMKSNLLLGNNPDSNVEMLSSDTERKKRKRR